MIFCPKCDSRCLPLTKSGENTKYNFAKEFKPK